MTTRNVKRAEAALIALVVVGSVVRIAISRNTRFAGSPILRALPSVVGICADGWVTPSPGSQGRCSWHGGAT